MLTIWSALYVAAFGAGWWGGRVHAARQLRELRAELAEVWAELAEALEARTIAESRR